MVRLRAIGETSSAAEGAACELFAMIVGSGSASQAAIRSYSATFRFLTRRFGALRDARAPALPATSLDAADGSLGGTTIAPAECAANGGPETTPLSAKGAVSAVGETGIRRSFEGFGVFCNRADRRFAGPREDSSISGEVLVK